MQSNYKALSFDDFYRKALISIQGEGAAEKAMELSGRDVGGWNITVDSVMPPKFSNFFFPTSST